MKKKRILFYENDTGTLEKNFGGKTIENLQENISITNLNVNRKKDLPTIT